MKNRKQSNFEHQRTRIHEIFSRFQNIRACGMGVKFVSGKSTGEPCLTVFVAKKIERKQLTKDDILPEAIRIGKHHHPIDVVEMGVFNRQSAPENYPFGVCLSDQRSNGTRSAFAKTTNGIMALTCSHVIAGIDGNPFTPAPIKSLNWDDRDFHPFGQSDKAVYENGNNTPLDFGYLDAALIKLLPSIEPNPFSTTPLSCFIPQNLEDIESIINKPVHGFGIASGDCHGIVQAVLVNGALGYTADIVIAPLDPNGLTRQGDSGMLWFDEGGRIIGQHVLGQEPPPPGKGSSLTIATFIHRIISKLQILSLH